MAKSKILFVFTSADKNLLGAQTGWYLPEAAHPYYILAPHFDIDFASPKGANPPVDESSVQNFKDDVKFLEDPVVKEKLATAKKLSEVNADDYVAVFYPGGHGPVIDLPFDPVNTELANKFFRSGKVTAAVCHGPAALVAVTDASGKSIFSGREATAFSNTEEEQVNMTKAVPFSVEDKIKELGGSYKKAADPWGVYVTVSDNLFTGQNPASAAPLAERILQALQKST
ncbi:ThiJ/PfpI [Panus rudis PR-1116 ss-1]|nr:ThiJ/PfpI [Panus rudis PR-1116 ss-1]